jgi:hypothetical protein
MSQATFTGRSRQAHQLWQTECTDYASFCTANVLILLMDVYIL